MTSELDRLGNRISHDKMGFLRRIRFCPSCSTRRLEKHTRDLDPFGKPIQGSEFWCSLCGFSFNVRISVEWGMALRLFQEHRKMRTEHRFVERSFDAGAVKAWKEKYERPIFRPQSTWNLGDKLKAALGMR